ncbi:major facilitator superfamily domain-containing protein [Auriculariales sp. MPI-PUGE-AT-0066]|nr:major facilitator superfamily domain-containing protein [Auriculariales sp. MPI-PUGE-AT-0066]
MASCFLLILATLAFASKGLCIIRVPRSTGNTTTYIDPANGVRYQRYLSSDYNIAFSLALPPVDNVEAKDQFIGTIEAPLKSGWVGLSLGAMVKSLQILVWADAYNLVFSPRWTDACNPTWYDGPDLVALPDSIVTDTHLRFSFHCTNCTEWLGGSLDTNAYSTLAWATSLDLPVTTPSDPTSGISYHPVTAFFGADLSAAHLTQEEWDEALSGKRVADPAAVQTLYRHLKDVCIAAAAVAATALFLLSISLSNGVYHRITSRICASRFRPAPPYTPVALELPNHFVAGGLEVKPLVSVQEVLAHLHLLGLFHNLRKTVEAGSWQDDTWENYVRAAVRRFKQWVVGVAQDGYRAPSLDIAMVWHTYMLNPTPFAKDAQRLPWLMVLDPLSIVELAGPFGITDAVHDTTDTGADTGAVMSSLQPSIDLVSAVIRQGSFITKIANLGWTAAGRFEKQADQNLIVKSIARYHAFLDLLAAHPGMFIVPTLDIDLSWHTHQLKGRVYRSDTKLVTGKMLGHDDTVEAPELSNGLQQTAAAWEARFGVPYSSCVWSQPNEKQTVVLTTTTTTTAFGDLITQDCPTLTENVACSSEFWADCGGACGGGCGSGGCGGGCGSFEQLCGLEQLEISRSIPSKREHGIPGQRSTHATLRADGPTLRPLSSQLWRNLADYASAPLTMQSGTLTSRRTRPLSTAVSWRGSVALVDTEPVEPAKIPIPSAVQGTTQCRGHAAAADPTRCAAVMSEFLVANVSSPWILFMVKSFGVGKDDGEVAYLTGILGHFVSTHTPIPPLILHAVAVFFLAQFVTSLVWSSLEGLVGRRAVISVSLFGSAVSCVLFGLQTTFTGAIVVRLIQGVFGGAVGAARSGVTVVADPSNEGRAYAIMGFAWGFGGTIGTIIGGAFESPALRWPDSFGGAEIWHKYPYFLACAVGSIIPLLGVILCFWIDRDGRPLNKLTNGTNTTGAPLSSTVDPRKTSGTALPARVGTLLQEGSRRPGLRSNSFASGRSQPVISFAEPDGRPMSSVDQRLNRRSMHLRMLSSGSTSLAARSWTHRRSVVASEHTDMNFTERLIAANENQIPSISQLWVEAAISTSDVVEQASDDDEHEQDGSYAHAAPHERLASDATIRGQCCHKIILPSETTPPLGRKHDHLSRHIHQPGVDESLTKEVDSDLEFAWPADSVTPPQKLQGSLFKHIPVMVIAQYGILGLHTTTYLQVFYSYLMTSFEAGGLGLTAGDFAQLMGSMSIGQIVWQFWVYPYVGPPRGPFSHLTMFRLGTLMFMLTYPSVIMYRGWSQGAIMPALFISTSIRFCAGCFTFTSVAILVNYMTPPEAVGFANGLAQSITSLARFVGPVLGAKVWEASIRNGPSGYPVGLLMCSAACLLTLIASYRIQ